jgi:hypothetical protein
VNRTDGSNFKINILVQRASNFFYFGPHVKTQNFTTTLPKAQSFFGVFTISVDRPPPPLNKRMEAYNLHVTVALLPLQPLAHGVLHYLVNDAMVSSPAFYQHTKQVII